MPLLRSATLLAYWRAASADWSLTVSIDSFNSSTWRCALCSLPPTFRLWPSAPNGIHHSGPSDAYFVPSMTQPSSRASRSPSSAPQREFSHSWFPPQPTHLLILELEILLFPCREPVAWNNLRHQSVWPSPTHAPESCMNTASRWKN